MGKKINIDLTGVESFQRASEGLHNVKVATADMKQSQGGNDMIVISFEVVKGIDKGSRVYENFPLVDTALWKLKSLLQALGIKADGKIQLDLDKLIGKVCTINVKHEEYEGKLRARVESIMKLQAEESEDSDDDDEDEELPFAEEAKPAKKGNKKAPMNPPADEDDEDWDEDDEDDEEEEEPAPKKPAKKEKAAEKPEKKQEKKPSKKSKKDDDEDEDDDWDDDDEDWDE